MANGTPSLRPIRKQPSRAAGHRAIVRSRSDPTETKTSPSWMKPIASLEMSLETAGWLTKTWRSFKPFTTIFHLWMWRCFFKSLSSKQSYMYGCESLLYTCNYSFVYSTKDCVYIFFCLSLSYMYIIYTSSKVLKLFDFFLGECFPPILRSKDWSKDCHGILAYMNGWFVW